MDAKSVCATVFVIRLTFGSSNMVKPRHPVEKGGGGVFGFLPAPNSESCACAQAI